MSPILPNSANTPGSSENGSGFLQPDAGPEAISTDTDAGTNDFFLGSGDSNMHEPAYDNTDIDEQVPETTRKEIGGNVVDRQLGSISRTPG
jgi:hypothetical protein